MKNNLVDKKIALAFSALLSGMAAHAGTTPPVNPPTNPPTNPPSSGTNTCATASGCVQVPQETVDLLIFYDNATNAQFGGNVAAAMQGWVNQANNMYYNSGVGLKIRLVGVEAYDPTGSSMSDVLTNLKNSRFADSRRDALKADFVTAVHGTGNCGVGYVAVNPSFAKNVVGPRCGAVTLAHELGHNMGLSHSRRQGDTGGTRYSYALGYGVDRQFVTVMAYPQSFNASSIGRFSNPNLSCRGYRCGVPENQQDGANSVLALNNVRNELRSFR